jgi:CheY-like chemotaxis protein
MKRVLVVDDDAPVRRIIRHHLVKDGFDVTEAANGLQALEVVRSTPVDLILMDIRMPMMNGYELADRLQADPLTAEIPIVVSSVVADEAHQRIVQAKTFLARPFTVSELVSAVRSALEDGGSGEVRS